jgi:hypothetical protein
MSTPPPSSRERLRQQWLQQAESVFDLMFDPDQQDQLVTFHQREQRVCTLTRELTVWLLEQHVAEDPAVCLPDSPPPSCPRCGRPARQKTPPGDPAPSRQVTCVAGVVTLQRQEWYCPRCRAAFFPSGSEAPIGD